METLCEPERPIPIVEDVDVLVAGSGPAGLAAALAAAREGAKTVMVERYGYLGGMITGAHVVAIIGVGDGHKPLARGVTLEIRERLEKRNAVKPGRCGDYLVDAEIFKWQAVEMLQEAGVRIRLHTMACMPIMDGQTVCGVFVESKSGRQAIRAKVTVDATADADLAFRAGCGCDNTSHEVTLGIKIEGIDRMRVHEFSEANPDAYEEAVAEATRLNGGVMLGKKRLLKDIDVADVMDLTGAEIKLREECFNALFYLKDHVPGYEEAHVVDTHPQIGVRQGRRIHGICTLTNDDLKNSRHFEDGIARLGVYFPD
jgi:ribulose 1,5-bisphosphate synthetase/thiazole synthase